MKQGRQFLAGVLAAAALSGTLPAAAAEGGYMTRGETAELLLECAGDYHPGVQMTDIMRGYGDGTLRETQQVTRAEALVMLSRAFGELPVPTGDNARSGYGTVQFTDIPAWAAEELADVWTAGIVEGTAAGLLAPDSAVTQEEMDRLIRRVYALEGINLKDDFYATVNKTALDASVIQPGYTGSGAFNDLAIEVNAQVADILREVVAAPRTEGERKMAALYNNIMDVDARNRAGVAPIQKYLDGVNGAQSVSELMEVCNTISRETGTSLLLGFGLTVDSKDSDAYLLTFSGFSPALGKNGYDGAQEYQKSAYQNYVKTMLKLVGQSDETAAEQAELIWQADAALAVAAMTNQELADVGRTYNLYTMQQLQQLVPDVDLNAVFAQSGLMQTDRILVMDPGALAAVAALFDGEHLETLRAYCLLSLASGFGACLNEEFTRASEVFQQAYLGVSGSVPLKELAAQYVQTLMSDYLGQAYVERHFSARAKADVEQMVQDIIGVYRERILALDWMSDATRAKAIAKLDAITLNIGYPDKWEDTLAETPILSVEQGGSFFDNIVAMSLETRRQMARMQKQGVDKTQWLMTPYTVNAYYSATANSINFPAGILQPPFYDVDAPYEQNLGRIGYVIAHEITHAFDNNGAKYNEHGNAADWWTEEDYAAFQALCADVVALYDGKEAAPGIACDGALTLSENIADLGAMACITQLEGQRQTPDYQALYTAAAQLWCSSYAREYRQYLAAVDLHAPDKLRGSLVLQNFEEFYQAFGITENDGMWLAPEERVAIW